MSEYYFPYDEWSYIRRNKRRSGSPAIRDYPIKNILLPKVMRRVDCYAGMGVVERDDLIALAIHCNMKEEEKYG